jgi:hypothetical protein
MKKTVFLLLMLFIASVCFAQNVTTFMGIPVDGTKSAMIQKLKGKGFTYYVKNDCLEGEFNGDSVLIGVKTVNGKVWRVCVLLKKEYDETQAKIKFNRLCQQFERNPKYVPPFKTRSQEIGEDEDISYEMTVSSKQYQAGYLQDGDEMRFVWFLISEVYGTYYITIYYENSYNAANGEDL